MRSRIHPFSLRILIRSRLFMKAGYNKILLYQQREPPIDFISFKIHLVIKIALINFLRLFRKPDFQEPLERKLYSQRSPISLTLKVSDMFQ